MRTQGIVLLASKAEPEAPQLRPVGLHHKEQAIAVARKERLRTRLQVLGCSSL